MSATITIRAGTYSLSEPLTLRSSVGLVGERNLVEGPASVALPDHVLDLHALHFLQDRLVAFATSIGAIPTTVSHVDSCPVEDHDNARIRRWLCDHVHSVSIHFESSPSLRPAGSLATEGGPSD